MRPIERESTFVGMVTTAVGSSMPLAVLRLSASVCFCLLLAISNEIKDEKKTREKNKNYLKSYKRYLQDLVERFSNLFTKKM